jgi:chromate transporter
MYFMYFLRIGSVRYGTGSLLIECLQGGLVDRLHWLTRTALLDAGAAGPFTPGAVLPTATFVGYMMFGWPGAIVATAGFFLPSFLSVVVTSALAGRLQRGRWTAASLDSANGAAPVLMIGVAIRLAGDALTRSRIVLSGALMGLLLL